MHNLFLGTSKHVLKSIWLEGGVLSDEDLDTIQSRVDSAVVPSDIGRIPYKIASNCSSFTADQFKNWVLYFSMLCLRDKLIDSHLKCWQDFVSACRLLCSKAISLTDCQHADSLLLKFSKGVQTIYGESFITPNMHFQTHIAECILDYGPAHIFWLFAFERLNGILGQQPHNNRSIETQLMTRFLRDHNHSSFADIEDFQDEFSPLFHNRRRVVGTLSGTDAFIHLPLLLNATLNDDWSINSEKLHFSLPSHSSRGVLAEDEQEQLKTLYSQLYNLPVSEILVNRAFMQYKEISLNSKQLGAFNSRSKHSSVVMCNWNIDSSAETFVSDHDRPVQIRHFLKHTVSIGQNSAPHDHLLFKTLWFKTHPECNFYGKPLTIWEHELFDASLIIPVQFIRSRTITLIDAVDEFSGNALFVVPCVDF